MARDRKHANGDKPNKHRKSRNAVLNLTIDGSSPNQEVREIKSSPDPTYLTPCTINGLVAGASGGMLGYAFGFREFVRQGVGNEFVGYWMRNHVKGTFSSALAEGWTSARTFALMGGLYAAVGCFAQRLRQKSDAWNGALSGCATGLAIGWSSGGPAAAAQNCAMLGALSYFLDGMGTSRPENESEHSLR